MAQAKQTQRDKVAFRHGGSPKTPSSPRQEGAAGPPILLLAPYWPSTGASHSHGGALEADISPCLKVQLRSGGKGLTEMPQMAPLPCPPPEAVGWSPSPSFPRATASLQPVGSSALSPWVPSTAPQHWESPDGAHAQPCCCQPSPRSHCAVGFLLSPSPSPPASPPEAPHRGWGGGQIWGEPPPGLGDTVPPGLLSLQSLPEGHSLISRASEEPQRWRVQKGVQRKLKTGQETKQVVTSGMEMGLGLAFLFWAQGT